jgi:acyl dehydratase
VGDYNPHHFEDNFSEKVMKTNGVILHGSLKRAWLAQMLTDWIGTEGWLKQLTTQFRGMDYPRHMKDFVTPEDGETWWCKGKVTEKVEENGEAIVKCEIWLENGSGEHTTPGSAVVRLPKRG